MADDIVTRPREGERINWSHYSAPPLAPLLVYAADEIERLRADAARLGSFLHPIGEEARRG